MNVDIESEFVKGMVETIIELKEFISMFSIDQLQGMFNHYMEMQKQAIHGQSGEFTINFWKEQAGKQLKIIEAYKALEAGGDDEGSDWGRRGEGL